MYKHTRKRNIRKHKRPKTTKRRRMRTQNSQKKIVKAGSTLEEKYGSSILGKDLVRGNYYKVWIARSYNGFGPPRTGNAQYYGTIYEYLMEKKKYGKKRY